MTSDALNKAARRIDLTTGPVRQHLVRLTVPVTWGIFAIISFQLVNTFYVSMLGTKPLAAISFTFPVTFIMFSVFMGFGIAMSSVISRLIGEGRGEDVRRVATHGLMLSFGVSVFFAILGLVFMNPIFRAMGANDEMLALIDDYMIIYFMGTSLISLPIVGNAAMRAAGDSFTQAMIMTVAALSNAILDPILIFGLLGFPRLELTGAAISTVLANACAMVAGLVVLHRKGIFAPEYLLDVSAFKDSAKRLLFIAVPAGLTSALPALVNSFIIYFLSRSGDAAVAAFGVATRVEAFAFIIMMALAVGMGPIIGQNFGAGRFDRVREALFDALKFCVIWSVIVALVLGLFAQPLSHIFSKDDAVAEILMLYFWIVPFSYAAGNLVSGWGSAFNAMGKPHYSAGMLFIKMIIVLIPAVYLGHLYGGIQGVFWAIAGVNLVTGIAIHMFSWKKIAAAHPAAAV